MSQTHPRIDRIARAIVAREGGYVNDPDDPGGATKHGVTLTTLRRLGRDLDGDGTVTLSDLRRLTPEQARDLFLQHYYRAPGIDGLPETLQPSVFDMQVNAGTQAVKILQHLLGEMGWRLAIDGIIGPATRRAAAEAAAQAPAHLSDSYGIARRNYYFALADRRPASRKYVRTRAGGKGGWITRAEEFIAPRYHLSARAFERRVAAWG
ncbi:holin-associated N-acetylmuramidase [Roseivivax sp.]